MDNPSYPLPFGFEVGGKMRVEKIRNTYYLKGDNTDRKLGYHLSKLNRFTTHRNKDHVYQKIAEERGVPGFSFNRQLIDKLIDEGIKEVVVIYKRQDGSEEIYKTTPKDVKFKGKEIDHEEPQYALCFHDFEVE